MKEQLLIHIRHHQLCKTSDKILLAVSGGVDSMVMLDLMRAAGFTIGVCHCNFSLRGQDADDDEQFVRQHCEQLRIPLFTSRFDTAAHAAQLGHSLQMAARSLRYEFFEQVRQKEGYDWIATAHHLDDSLETVLLNLTRGTGFRGLTGIPVKNQKVIRPLLFASHAQVMEYAKARNIAWRDDLSNDKDTYARNAIRHHVVPRLLEINPGLMNAFADSTDRLRAAGYLLQQRLESLRSEIVQAKQDQRIIDRAALMQYGYVAAGVLWELLREYEFHFDQCVAIVSDHQAGKRFYSNKHMITVDRDTLIVSRRQDQVFQPVAIESFGQDIVSEGQCLRITHCEMTDFSLSEDRSVASLDAAKIALPLVWRKWATGDVFVPLGMNGSKKVSDFLIDEKIAMPDKDRVTVIEKNGEIVWIVGMRISDNYKITPETKRVLQLSWSAV